MRRAALRLSVVPVAWLAVTVACSSRSTPAARAPAADPNARTLYTGSVRIRPVPLAVVKSRLDAKGCRPADTDRDPVGCMYRSRNDARGDWAVEVLPHGLAAFGPSSFVVSRDSLSATRDIPGPPDPAKYQQEVREMLRELANPVELEEGTWVLTETTYPWTVLY